MISSKAIVVIATRLPHWRRGYFGLLRQMIFQLLIGIVLAMATHGKMSYFDATKEKWTSYAERLDFYFEANNVTVPEKKRAIFLTVCGPSTYDLLKSLLHPNNPKEKTYAELKECLEKHFDPKPSSIVQRFKFNTRIRNSDESVATYVANLRAIGEHCDFGDTLELMIRDRLVCGINDTRIQRRLLQEPNLTYKCAFETAQAMEVAAKDFQDITQRSSTKPTAVYRLNEKPTTTKKIECFRCGGNHYANKCSFKESTCYVCEKKGHLARVCRSGTRQNKKETPATKRTSHMDRGKPQVPPRRYATHTVEQLELPPEEHSDSHSYSSSQEDYPLFTLPGKTRPIVVAVQVQGVDLPMELDTGASLSLISETTYSKLSNILNPLTQSNITLTTYTGEQIFPLGSIDVLVKYQSQTMTLPLLVVPGDGPTLLGRNWLEKIKLNWSDIKLLNSDFSTLEQVLERHTAVFTTNIGKLKDITAKIQVSPEASPRFFKARPVPHTLKEKVIKELQHLQDLHVITPVRHSEWAAPIVPVVKSDGSIRLCGDYKVTVNQVLLPDTYPLPRVDDLFAALSGGKVFTKLDLSHAYLQVPLDDPSKKYTTINTPKGLFQYERLPFGISTAPSIFQRIMENLLSDLPHICVYLDDILISGTDHKDHLQNLHIALQRLETAGLTLKKEKCKFLVPSVEYLGHVIDENGLHPSESKVKAIKEAPIPTNITELRSFLGLLNYYHKFLPDLSTILAPLHQLLRKEAKWVWSTAQDKAFKQTKSLLHSSSLLVHYDEQKPLVLSCDASPYGLGAVLSHQMNDNTEKPIAFTSRTLTTPEKKYSQLEKEALAIIFAVRKFHDYLYGRHFTLYSDHKPLQYLLGQSRQIPTPASPRIQRWAITLSSYSYTIKHKPGTQLANADALSRLPLPDKPKFVPIPADIKILLNHLSDSIIKAPQIKTWTDQDPVLSRVRKLVQTGWSPSIKATELQPYSHCYTELSVIDGCLLRGSRVIIPPQGRQQVLSQLHDTHPGTSRMKSLARAYVWWPGVDKDIEQLVKQCEICQTHRPSPPQSVIHPWECPSAPWIRVHVDHAGPFLGKNFLLLVDAYSRWIEVHIVDSTSAESTIKTLRQIFSIHGLPQQLVSDNGPAFISQDFKQFMNKNGIRHSLTSPYHPRSNGLAERAVQTFKSSIKKLDGPIDTRLTRFLLQYRITPQSTTGLSPSELLMGRRLRTVYDLLHPDIQEKVETKQTKIPQPHQKIRTFSIGDKLYAKNYSGSPTWIPVTVVKVTGPVSYHVETENGIVIRRHTDQLRLRYTKLPEFHSELQDFSNEILDDIDDFPVSKAPQFPPSQAAPDIHAAPQPLRRSTRDKRQTNRYAPYVSS